LVLLVLLLTVNGGATVNQCMSNMGPLTEYFIAKKHEPEINERNIMGSGGKVSGLRV
jgi:hypothetical protein